MRILILVDWFIPGYKGGGPIQSSANIAFALKDKYEIYVLTTDTDHGETLPYPGIVANKWTNDLHPKLNVFYAKKASLTVKQLRHQIKAIDPDYIYLNHLFSPKFVVFPIWLKFLGRLKNKIVVCPRGALYDSALSVKWYKKKPFLLLFKKLRINRMVTFHATNEREKEAIEKFFPGSNIHIADNLPKTIQLPFASTAKTVGSLRCIFVARIFPIKNLSFLLQALSGVKGNVELNVVGPVEDADYWNECQQLINKLPYNIVVNYMGGIENAKLPALINQHHLFALPTTGENFGHSIFEAFLTGRPVLISDQTPWLNLTEKKIGWDLPLQITGPFTLAIETACNWDQHTFNEWATASWSYANRFINNPSLHKSYFELFA